MAETHVHIPVGHLVEILHQMATLMRTTGDINHSTAVPQSLHAGPGQYSCFLLTCMKTRACRHKKGTLIIRQRGRASGCLPNRGLNCPRGMERTRPFRSSSYNMSRHSLHSTPTMLSYSPADSPAMYLRGCQLPFLLSAFYPLLPFVRKSSEGLLLETGSIKSPAC